MASESTVSHPLPGRWKWRTLGNSWEPPVYPSFRLLFVFEGMQRGREVHAEAAPLRLELCTPFSLASAPKTKKKARNVLPK